MIIFVQDTPCILIDLFQFWKHLINFAFMSIGFSHSFDTTLNLSALPRQTAIFTFRIIINYVQINLFVSTHFTPLIPLNLYILILAFFSNALISVVKLVLKGKHLRFYLGN